ncbi:MAG: M56 family metallopeptidase [Pirellulales bacterium]
MMMASIIGFGELNLLGELIFIGDDLSRLFVMQCIQVTLLALCIWPLARLFAGSRPHLAHALWGLVLIKCLTPPIFALPYSPFCSGDVHAWLGIPSEAPQAIEPQIESHLHVSVENTPDTATTSLSPDLSPSMVRISPTIIAVDTGSPENEQARNPSSKTSAFQVLVALSLGVWISGSLLSLTAVAWKLHRFLKNVRSRRVAPLPATIQSLNDLLNVRSAAPNQTVPNRRSKRSTLSRVRVEIVDCDIGPAVVGWLRPRILIPRLLEQACTPDQLRMLMAHELTHVRRGDLRWALIQTLAGCVWWFHPLIRIVVRRFELETERSCDAETVARLGCSPAEYARGLLSVLEFKHRLRAAPALPGVRPIDLTQKRMEQIMRLQNGINRERSWFVFFVMVIGSLVALPGAAWVSAQQPDDKPLRAAEPQGVFILDTGSDLPTPLPQVSLESKSNDDSASSANEPETLRVYHIGKVLDAMQADEKCDRDTAMTLTYYHFLAEVGLDRTQAASKIKSDLANESLIVRGSAKLHTAMAEIIERIGRFGLAQVSVGTQIVSLERGKLESFELDWNYASNLEQNDPVLIAILSKADRDQLITKLQADPRTNILQTPRDSVQWPASHDL